jgi:hypothetical protein
MKNWLISGKKRNWHAPCKDVGKPAKAGKANKGKTKMSTENKAQESFKESESRLWVAVALSMSMIFTSYAISVFNHQEDNQVNAYTHSQRPIVVSYLA